MYGILSVRMSEVRNIFFYVCSTYGCLYCSLTCGEFNLCGGMFVDGSQLNVIAVYATKLVRHQRG